MINTRVLSHRVRGFGPVESSLSNIRRAIADGVRIIELDTRHTKDDGIVVCHPPSLEVLTRDSGLICEAHLSRVTQAPLRGDADGRLAELRDVLSVVAATSDVELWIDVKDIGLEDQYVRYVSEAGLKDRVRIISWAPDAVIRFGRLDSGIRLGWSCWHLQEWPRLWAMLRALAFISRRTQRPLRAARARRRLADLWGTILYFQVSQAHESYWKGHNHSVISRALPNGELFEVLRVADGAVGMVPWQASARVVANLREAHLGTYVYSVDGLDRLTSFAKASRADVVFSNDRSTVLGWQRLQSRPSAAAVAAVDRAETRAAV